MFTLTFYVLGSCFRTLADILVSDFFLIVFCSKYKAHKLHERYMLKKECPPVAHIPFISGTQVCTGRRQNHLLFKTFIVL